MTTEMIFHFWPLGGIVVVYFFSEDQDSMNFRECCNLLEGRDTRLRAPSNRWETRSQSRK